MATSTKKQRSRFINVQRHKASCGPIAIANAIKWFGTQTSYKSVLEFCEIIGAYRPTQGMWPHEIRFALKKLEIPVKVKRTFSVQLLDEILEDKGAVILTYVRKDGAHAVFLDSKSELGYRVWNRISGAKPWYPRRTIKRDIKRTLKETGRIYVYIFQALR